MTAVGAPATGQLPAQPEPRRGNRGVMTLLVVLLLLVVGLGGWLLYRAVQESNLVTVPQVKTLSESAATTALQAQGLVVGTSTAQTDDAAAGTVIDSDPEEGQRVEPKSTVVLTVSSGPGSTAVPDVVGKTEAQAVSTLEDQRLKEGTVTYENQTDVPRGTVLRSDPQAGTSLPVDSEVALVLASGQVSLTDLTGQTQEQAVKALQALGLTPLITPQADAAVAGTVIGMNPDDGTVPAGSSVQLVVSSGPAVTPSPSESAPSSSPSEEASQDPSADPSASGDPSASATPTSGTTLQTPAGEPSASAAPAAREQPTGGPPSTRGPVSA